ncbi:MAG: hypothetical protein WDA06_05805 [Phenylobacterium sp.]
MPSPKFKSLSSVLNKVNEDLTSNHNISVFPDIITFCEHPDYLNMSARNINLYPMQRIILKIFYRGSIGNENLQLTDEEIQLCKDHGLDTSERGDALNRYYTDSRFRELVLIWGRRSGKDFLVSIIAAYEAAKLIECTNGDPYAFYGLSAGNLISILTIANAGEQARVAFEQIKDKILYSKYFKDKIGPDGVGASEIYLLTKRDKDENVELKQRKLPLKKGSICVEVGHSNTDSLVGKGIFVLILDEVAGYKNTGGASSGDRIYAAMTPALSTFVRETTEIKPNGDVIKNKIYDAKIVSISSPRGEDGIFYKLYKGYPSVPDRLVCKLPSWEVNPNHTRESLRKANSSMSDDEFMMEIGAEFSGTAGQNFFPRDWVEKCFCHEMKLRNIGEPGRLYFVHVDPATSSHNYAVVVLHKEIVINPAIKESDFIIVVDHIKFWHPSPGNPIREEEIDKYIIALKYKFHIAMVTYDQWNSSKSIENLKKHGIPAKKTAFSRRYKMIIYDELYRLVIEGKVKIPYHELLLGEMINLQRKFMPNGYRVYPNKASEIKTDDVVDCVAGATYGAIINNVANLPRGKLVQFGNPSSNQHLWQSMQGPIGYGTGQSVTKALESKSSWPGYKR